jgi:N-acetyltransferase
MLPGGMKRPEAGVRAFRPRPVTLVGRVVRLEPLQESHVSDLCQVGLEPKIWRYMLYGVIDTPEKLLGFVQELLRRQALKTDLPFAVVYRPTGKAIGCTRYMDIQRQNRALEIGGTWYGLAFQRTAVNTEAKYLLLSHAFEQLGAVRVQFKTDIDNLRSQQALERIGAVREGVLRHHMQRPDGSLRSSAYYSILAEEWPGVRSRLLGLLVGVLGG